MTSDAHADQCIAALKARAPPCTAVQLMRQCDVPSGLWDEVAGRLSASPMVHVTGLSLEHVWVQLSRALAADAVHEVIIDDWAQTRNVPHGDGFRAYVMHRLTPLKLHSRKAGSVRTQTPLNAYDAQSLLLTLRTAGLRGVAREVAVSEYNTAYVDMHRMEDAGDVFATCDRVWYVRDVTPPCGLTKFHGLVSRALQYDQVTVHQIMVLMRAEHTEVEFALIDLCNAKLARSVGDALFVFRPPLTNISSTDCPDLKRCRRTIRGRGRARKRGPSGRGPQKTRK